MTMIDRDSFEMIKADASEFHGTGTVLVTVGRETRRVAASYWYGTTGRTEIIVYGIAVKYRTGSKVWQGNVALDLASGNERVRGGFENHTTSRRIAKVVGFFDDVKQANREHMGVKA